ncbi:TonB-dependent receptor [Sphingomonas sp. HF-S4]|uniref:TonB-dependent receptor n=1 Tax=Sphingomonas agrestis TaxID=3080540 RepID=A0ABU3Y795_9SPHN|nr:TonB-dependent receptor [Sphingomonas sp. HF-S4]MDV3457181.1 TonB-dependent receptor [Sphingomonas sp. HF-S4]
MKKLDLLAATALSLLLATPAFAQDTADPAARAGDETQTEEYQGANDIVVTATRRNETVQDIPVAVTALAAELLANSGVQDIRGLEQIAPSVQTSTGQSSATGTTLYIRGITTAGDNPGFEPAVGVFIDGVYRARAGVAVAELPELERIEVLRGPQGTLFGRNTSAGALSIVTAQPKFEFGGFGEFTYGNYNAIEARGGLTGPVSEQLALRLDGGYRKRDGYIEDVNSDRSINDVNRWYARGQALLDTGDITFRLIGDYYETDEQCCGAVSVIRGPTAAAIEGIAAAQGLDGLYTGAPRERRMAISPNRDFSERVRDWGVSGELNWDLGDVSFTSITAYRDWRARRNQDIDFSGIDRAYRDGYLTEMTDFTQEVRFNGKAFDGKLDWLIGGFYLNETNKLRDTVRLGNDANRYVDTLLGAAIAAPPAQGGLGVRAQFFGTSTVPTFGQLAASFQGGPALPAGTVPLASQLIYLQNPLIPVPGVGNVRLQTLAPPGSPLFAYLNTPLTQNAAGQGNTDNFRVKTNAFALFTHNVINLADNLSLTLGARWNHESKDLDASISNNTAACAFFYSQDPRAATLRALYQGASSALYNNLFLLSCNPVVNTSVNGNYTDDRSENALTGTAKLAFKITPDVLLYGGYDRGYKSGGYNLDQSYFAIPAPGTTTNTARGSDLQFDKETVDAFEIGLKTRWGRAFTFNIAGFYQTFHGLQSLIFSGNNFVVQNIDKTVSKGVEVESIIQPVRDLTFRLGYSYISATYDKSNDFTGTPLQGQEGLQLNNQPEHTVAVSTTWTPTISGDIKGLVHVDMRYNSEVNIPSSSPNPVTGRTALYNQGYPLINARIGVQSADRSKSLEFFVENLTNEFYYVTGFAVPEQTGTYAGYPGMPRFYGVKARFGF